MSVFSSFILPLLALHDVRLNLGRLSTASPCTLYSFWIKQRVMALPFISRCEMEGNRQHWYLFVLACLPLLSSLPLAVSPDSLPCYPTTTWGSSLDAGPITFANLHQFPFVVLATLLWSFGCPFLGHYLFPHRFPKLCKVCRYNDSLIHILHRAAASLVKP